MSDMYSKHFSKKELACPTTDEIKLQVGFIDHLELLRTRYGHPMQITSACRTREHNAWLKSRGYPASDNSFHLIRNPKYGTDTCAVDVAMPESSLRAKLIHEALSLGWTVGIAKTFLHFDKRAEYTSLPQIVYFY